VSQIRGIGPLGPVQPTAPGRTTFDGVGGFDTELERFLQRAPKPEAPQGGGEVSFSRHANARLASRGIELDRSDLEDLSEAVDQLARKGARESLVLMDENAFIVGIPDRRVITVMTRGEAVGNIFTNIDSTLVVR